MHKQSAYILVLAVAVLVTLGLVMLYSTGAFAPDSHGDQFNFLKKQSFWLGVGIRLFHFIRAARLPSFAAVVVRNVSDGARFANSLLHSSDRNANQWFLALDSCRTSDVSTLGTGQAGGDHFCCVVVLEI